MLSQRSVTSDAQIGRDTVFFARRESDRARGTMVENMH